MKQKAYFETREGGTEITYREPLGQTLFAATLYTIGYSCLIVAFLNLLFLRPLPLSCLLASLAWIAIMLFAVGSGCRRNGVRQHFGNVLGNFIRNRFAQFVADASVGSILSFGYRCGNKRHYFLKVRSKGITLVDWGPGQGNIPGKDNDWNVAMWFDPGAVIFDGIHDGVSLYIVGPSGPKAGREIFGTGFIDFLKANQVSLALPLHDLLGQEAEVVVALRPFGRIKIGQTEYPSRPLERMIDKGSRVVVEEIRGTSIYARQIQGPNKASDATSEPAPGAASSAHQG
jgi:hypothetical protein